MLFIILIVAYTKNINLMEKQMSVEVYRAFPDDQSGQKVGWASVYEYRDYQPVLNVRLGIGVIGTRGSRVISLPPEDYSAYVVADFDSVIGYVKERDFRDGGDERGDRARFLGKGKKPIASSAKEILLGGGVDPQDWQTGDANILAQLKEQLERYQRTAFYPNIYYEYNLGAIHYNNTNNKMGYREREFGSENSGRAPLLVDPAQAEETKSKIEALQVAIWLDNITKGRIPNTNPHASVNRDRRYGGQNKLRRYLFALEELAKAEDRAIEKEEILRRGL